MPVGLTVQVALATALGGLVAGLCASWVAVSTLDVDAAVAVRALLVLALVVAGPYVLVRRRVLAAGRRDLVVAGLVGLAVGYAVNPFAWSGRAFVSQAVLAPGAITTVLDLLAWVGLGAIGVVAAGRSASAHHEARGYSS